MLNAPILIILFALCNTVYAQALRSPMTVRYMGVGTYSRHFTDLFSMINNQAALATIKTPTAGVYTERKYLLKELNLLRAVIAHPLKQGSAALTAGYSGFKSYNESQLGLAYGRSLGKSADLGVQVNYNQVRITGYGSASAINFEIGSIFHVTEKLHTGCHIYNPFGVGKFKRTPGEKLSAVYTIGVGYEASEKLYLGLEAGKEENQPVNINATFHYAFLDSFFIRCGIASSSTNSFAGVGLQWQNFRTDVSITWHRQLGFTPSFLIIFNMKQHHSDED